MINRIMVTASSFPGDAIFLSSQHLQKSALIFTALWTPMDDKVPICLALNCELYWTAWVVE